MTQGHLAIELEPTQQPDGRQVQFSTAFGTELSPQTVLNALLCRRRQLIVGSDSLVKLWDRNH